MRVTFVTLFPGFFDGPMGSSIPARAVAAGALEWATVNPRDFATDRHRTVDDAPFGGGAGMLLRADVMADALAWAKRANPGAPTLLMSPQGRPFAQRDARALAACAGAILVCGRYEGVDERFVERCVDAEVSIGDFVLSGGEPAALCVVDAVARLLPGVLGNDESAVDESFTRGWLEHPQFTRPASWHGLEAPPVLRSGDHGAIARWRRKAAILRTHARRGVGSAPPTDRKDEKILRDERVDVPAWLVRPRHLDSAVDDAGHSCILRRPDAPGPGRTERDS